MRLSRTIIAVLTFTGVGTACFSGAYWAVNMIERRSVDAVERALLREGEDWVSVRADGLQLHLTGQAESETERFRALTVSGSVVDATRLIDAMTVTDPDMIEPPRFSVEILRNDDGISVFGLVPAQAGSAGIVNEMAALAPGIDVADMLETADHSAPESWDRALAFGLFALELLPRSKISISANRIAVTAVGDSNAAKRRLETELARNLPDGILLDLDISAPRPVITPFTLRFIIDEEGARFDACSADNERGRDRILAAGIAAGASGKLSCTLGLGVPSTDWATAATLGIAALAGIERGSVTFSDADVTLIAAATTPQDTFDRIVGDLEADLPPVFSLNAVLQETLLEERTDEGPRQFTATLSPEGQVQLRGRLTDELEREAVDSYARARFGSDRVYTATRLDPELPDGWPVRALAALEAMAELDSGSLTMRSDLVEVRGVTGNPDASDTISRVLSNKLGPGQEFRIDVRYDERLDPLAGLPTPQECAAEINRILDAEKVTFAPGSADIEAAAARTLDAVADMVRQCPDVEMEIGGHTDSQGRASMNLALSQDRADSVLSALMDRRVLVGSLTAKGYGAEHPISDNATEAGREANRRIEFRLILPEADETGEEPETAEASDDAPVEGELQDTEPALAQTDGEGAEDVGGPAPDREAGEAETGIEVEVQDPDAETPRPRARPRDG